MCLKLTFLILAVYNLQTNAKPKIENYTQDEIFIESKNKSRQSLNIFVVYFYNEIFNNILCFKSNNKKFST